MMQDFEIKDSILIKYAIVKPLIRLTMSGYFNLIR